VADEAFKHYVFQGNLPSIIRKPLGAFIIIYITNSHTSQDV